MPIKTHCQTYSKSQTLAIVAMLVAESRWFRVEPHCFDAFEIAVKAEETLPVVLGVDNQGGVVTFEEWIPGVDWKFEGELSQESKNSFFGYFVRGLSPAEAIAQDIADCEAAALEEAEEDGQDVPA